MPRRGGVKIRNVEPDPVYQSTLVAKFINRSMKGGKKSVASKHFYEALEIIEKETKEKPLEIFNQAVENVKPSMEVRPRRVGGAAYQVPVPVKGRRRESLAIRWLIASARKKSNSEYKTFASKMAAELMDAAKKEGGAVKKREEVERIAESNKAFAHFKW